MPLGADPYGVIRDVAVNGGAGRHGAPKGISFGHPALTAGYEGGAVDGERADVVIGPYGVLKRGARRGAPAPADIDAGLPTTTRQAEGSAAECRRRVYRPPPRQRRPNL